METQSNPAPAPNMPPAVNQPHSNIGGTGLPQNQSPAQTSSPQTPPPAAKKKLPTKLIAIIAVVLVLLIGGLLAVSLLTNRSSSNSGPADLVWWGLWEDESTVAPLISEFEQQNPGITIKYEMQAPQDYRERLVNSLSQGKGPDIFKIHNTWAPMFKNFIEPLPSSVMSPAEYAQTFYPVATSDFTDIKTGNLLAIPLEVDTIAMFINEEIFETNLTTVPTTWDELLETATALTIKDSSGVIRQSGAALGRTENVDHWQEVLAMIMLQNNVRLSNPQGEQAEQVLDYFTRFSKRGIWDATQPSSTQAFANGNVAIYFGPSWRVHEIQQLKPDLRFRVVRVPQLRKQTPDQPDVTYATYWADSVWNKSKNAQAAWKFLKFMSSKESQEKFFTNASKSRGFGEPYARADMQSLLINNPTAGVFVAQAPEAKSWFLASRTFDGPTGINSQIGKYFEDAVNGVNTGDSFKEALQTVSTGVADVLSKYGIQTQ